MTRVDEIAEFRVNHGAHGRHFQGPAAKGAQGVRNRRCFTNSSKVSEKFNAERRQDQEVNLLFCEGEEIGESLLAQKVGVLFSSPLPHGVQNTFNPRGFQVDRPSGQQVPSGQFCCGEPIFGAIRSEKLRKWRYASTTIRGCEARSPPKVFYRRLHISWISAYFVGPYCCSCGLLLPRRPLLDKYGKDCISALLLLVCWFPDLSLSQFGPSVPKIRRLKIVSRASFTETSVTGQVQFLLERMIMIMVIARCQRREEYIRPGIELLQSRGEPTYHPEVSVLEHVGHDMWLAEAVFRLRGRIKERCKSEQIAVFRPYTLHAWPPRREEFWSLSSQRYLLWTSAGDDQRVRC